MSAYALITVLFIIEDLINELQVHMNRKSEIDVYSI